MQHGHVPPPPQHNLQQCFLDFQSSEVFTWKCRPCTELNGNNCAFPGDIPWNSIEANCDNLLFLHPETLCTTEKATGPQRCAQTRERHQTKLQWWNEGNELCRNAGKRTGKAVWLGTDNENIQAEDSGKFIQISSDYLPSVTKYEAPANAIEQKSTKQKSCFIQSPGMSGFV